MRTLPASLFLAALLPLLPVAGGCNAGKTVTMADDFDLDIFGPHEDQLHSPYAAGAQFHITVENHDDSGGRSPAQAGWKLVSSNPAVLSVTPDGQATAGTPGEATLAVRDAAGAVLDTHTVTVAVPDRVGIYAEGRLLTGASDAEAEVTQASIIAGGEATFLVRYFAAGAELYGNHALAPAGSGGVRATTATSSFARARDFLQVTAPGAGSKAESVSLQVGGRTLGVLPVVKVDPAEVTGVTIDSQSDAGAAKGVTRYVYAHAIDRSAADVYGVSFSWSASGQPERATMLDGPSDVFQYAFDPSATETVTASFEGFSPSTTVHGVGGVVGTTAAVGCSAAGAPGTGGAPAALVLALAASGLLAARRRRPARG